MARTCRYRELGHVGREEPFCHRPQGSWVTHACGTPSCSSWPIHPLGRWWRALAIFERSASSVWPEATKRSCAERDGQRRLWELIVFMIPSKDDHDATFTVFP